MTGSSNSFCFASYFSVAMASIVLESSKVILSFVLCYFENSRLSRLHEMLGFFIGPVLTLSASVAIFAFPYSSDELFGYVI